MAMFEETFDDKKNLLWTGVIFFIAPLLLHVAWWQALLIALFMSACWILRYGQGVIRSAGVVVLLWSLLTWSGALPSTDHWLSIAAR
jgi:hypothetical protein